VAWSGRRRRRLLGKERPRGKDAADHDDDADRSKELRSGCLHDSPPISGQAAGVAALCRRDASPGL
jgi:hypothetical protein